jgi:3-deoxy-D-manno-octulosonic-acid transferase
MRRLLYNLAFLLVFPFFAPGYLWKMWRRGRSGRGFGQRFGLFGPKTSRILAGFRGAVWMHAVSVGEVQIASALIREWRRRDPGLRVVLSVTTVTGHDTAQRNLGTEDVPIVFNPIDWFPFVRAFFERLRPSMLVLVEAELWPNYLWEARSRGVPVMLVNARLSERTGRRLARNAWFTRPLLELVSRVGVQNERDARRFAELGVAASRITLTGSMKYEVSRIVRGDGVDAGALLRMAGWETGRPVFLAGSTHAGEERIAARVWRRVRERVPGLFLVIAPRHFERGGEVSRMLDELGVPHVRRSRKMTGAASDVMILDSTGELRAFFALASVTFIGKSLTGRGGQNFLEAVQSGRPVLFGPHMENFREMAEEFVAAGGAVRVADEAALGDAVERCLTDPAFAAGVADAALRLFASRLGALDRTLDLLGAGGDLSRGSQD